MNFSEELERFWSTILFTRNFINDIYTEKNSIQVDKNKVKLMTFYSLN